MDSQEFISMSPGIGGGGAVIQFVEADMFMLPLCTNHCIFPIILKSDILLMNGNFLSGQEILR